MTQKGCHLPRVHGQVETINSHLLSVGGIIYLVQVLYIDTSALIKLSRQVLCHLLNAYLRSIDKLSFRPSINSLTWSTPEARLPVGRQTQKIERLMCSEFRWPDFGYIPGQNAHPNGVYKHHRDAVLEGHSVPLRDVPGLCIDTNVGIFISERQNKMRTISKEKSRRKDLWKVINVGTKYLMILVS